MRGKDQRITFHCLHSHYSMSAVPHHSACQKHWLEEGGIPPGELHICEKERASEMKRGKERPEKTKKCNKCKWCYSLRCYHRLAVVSHVSCVVKIMNSATVVAIRELHRWRERRTQRERERTERERKKYIWHLLCSWEYFWGTPGEKGIKHTEEELEEGWKRREIRDPKWLDWIKMAGVEERLSIYTAILAWMYIHVKQGRSIRHY